MDDFLRRKKEQEKFYTQMSRDKQLKDLQDSWIQQDIIEAKRKESTRLIDSLSPNPNLYDNPITRQHEVKDEQTKFIIRNKQIEDLKNNWIQQDIMDAKADLDINFLKKKWDEF